MISIKFTKKALGDPALLQRLQQPMVLARALAVRIRERVSMHGDLATRAEAYKTERRQTRGIAKLNRAYDRTETALMIARQSASTSARSRSRIAELSARLSKLDDAQQKLGEKLQPYAISEAYAKALGVTETRYRSSAAFHDSVGVKPGTFRVTGKMWESLGVRNSGASALLDFFGSSLGARRQATTTKTGRARSAPVQVRNQSKAGAVFRHSRVNVIQPKPEEEEAMAAAVCRWSQHMIARTLGAVVGDFRAAGDQQLLQDILRLYDGR